MFSEATTERGLYSTDNHGMLRKVDGQIYIHANGKRSMSIRHYFERQSGVIIRNARELYEKKEFVISEG